MTINQNEYSNTTEIYMLGSNFIENPTMFQFINIDMHPFRLNLLIAASSC